MILCNSSSASNWMKISSLPPETILLWEGNMLQVSVCPQEGVSEHAIGQGVYPSIQLVRVAVCDRGV